MNNVKEEYLSYIDEKTAEFKLNSQAYKADNRKDEAGLEMVKANIYELFRTLFVIDTKQLEGKDLSEYKNISLFADYLLRFETVPANWKISLEKAKEHGDTIKQVIEETKLAAAQELKDKLVSLVNEILEGQTYDRN